MPPSHISYMVTRKSAAQSKRLTCDLGSIDLQEEKVLLPIHGDRCQTNVDHKEKLEKTYYFIHDNLFIESFWLKSFWTSSIDIYRESHTLSLNELRGTLTVTTRPRSSIAVSCV